MRIAYFTETFLPHTDGVVTRLTHTLTELRAAGHVALVVAPRAPKIPSTYEGAQVIQAPSIRFPMYPDMRLGLPMVELTRRAELHAFTPDIVHALNPVVLGMRALWYARFLGVPFVASYHTNVPTYAQRYHLGALEGTAWSYLRLIHNRARLNLCTSRPVQQMLEARGFKRVAVWQPGVDASLFHPDRRKSSWRARLTSDHPDAVILLYVGRLAREKGLDLLAPALAQLKGCHLALIGDGPDRAQVERTFAGLPATFLGPLYGDDLAAAYASADLFVLPSSTETLGLAAIEAMASGLPVVGARRGGIPFVVAEQQTGVLFDPDVADDLLRQIRPLVEACEARERMGHAGRLRATEWSWAATTADLVKHYRQLLPPPTTTDESSMLVVN
jgi:glycosyltransferase involved in cell wall biosynthesis